MSTSKEYQFQSEAKQVLDLMVHSVYSNPDIFLRELVSNASDAIDKLRIEGLKDSALADLAADGKIDITVDKENRTLTVSDNGIGMSRDELVDYLGTIAKSGTKEFIMAMQKAGSGDNSDLIGQFGIGFYSSFIIADKVTVETKRAPDGESLRWQSEGDGTYTISEGSRRKNGTDITLSLKEKPDDENAKDYLSRWVLHEIIKRYSDFVTYPIRINEIGEDPNEDPVNSMKAIWTKQEDEVTDEEYNDFYRHITHDREDPMERITYKAEGTSEFRALLYIPSRPPFDLFLQGMNRGIQLYIKRVFIMNDCEDLIPDYLRFVRGVVDSEDLPLNVSREILQQDRQTEIIKNNLTRKVLESLKNMKEERPDDYKKFWQIFGMVLKEGIVSDAKNRENIMKLCLLESSDGDTITLEQYREAMSDDQKYIYYLAGAPVQVLKDSPKLEAFNKRGIEVLLLGDPIDEVWINAAMSFDGVRFLSAASEEVDLDGESADEKEAEDEVKKSGLATKLKEALSDAVEEVKISSRLVDSPVCFVQKGEPISPQMRNFYKAMGQELPEEKKVLELNPGHPLIKKIAAEAETDRANLKDWGDVLMGLASISDGEPVPNGADFTKKIASLLEK